MKLTNLLQSEFETRVIDESIPRIKKCLSLIDETDLWKTPNDKITSVGNSIQHLIGNTKQWILSGLFNNRDERNRDIEFTSKELTIKDLIDQLDQLENELKRSLNGLTKEILKRDVVIQGFEVNGLSSLIHVIEHFSYHTGQITLLTKLYSNKETDYYGETDLNVRN